VSQGVCPNSLLFCCFQFGFTFESIKELGGASQGTLALFNVDIQHKHGKDNVLPNALSQKQLKVVYVGKTKLQKEVQLVNRYDKFAKEMKQNIQKGIKSHFHLWNGLLWYK